MIIKRGKLVYLNSSEIERTVDLKLHKTITFEVRELWYDSTCRISDDELPTGSIVVWCKDFPNLVFRKRYLKQMFGKEYRHHLFVGGALKLSFRQTDPRYWWFLKLLSDFEPDTREVYSLVRKIEDYKPQTLLFEEIKDRHLQSIINYYLHSSETTGDLFLDITRNWDAPQIIRELTSLELIKRGIKVKKDFNKPINKEEEVRTSGLVEEDLRVARFRLLTELEDYFKDSYLEFSNKDIENFSFDLTVDKKVAHINFDVDTGRTYVKIGNKTWIFEVDNRGLLLGDELVMRLADTDIIAYLPNNEVTENLEVLYVSDDRLIVKTWVAGKLNRKLMTVSAFENTYNHCNDGHKC